MKEFLVPGSTWFLLIGVTFGVCLLAGPAALRRWGQRWLVALTVAYWMLSVPFVSETLAVGVGSPHRLSSDGASHGITAVVALANGINRYKVGDLEIDTLMEESAYTVLESIRLYRQLGSPLIVASGGLSRPQIYKHSEADVMRDALVAQGVASERIVLESRSGTTREQAMNIAPILRSRGIERFALVTSPIHMPRALQAFRAESLDPVPAPSSYGSGSSDMHLIHSSWRPMDSARVVGERAIYEYIGRLYYLGRGWSSRAGG